MWKQLWQREGCTFLSRNSDAFVMCNRPVIEPSRQLWQTLFGLTRNPVHGGRSGTEQVKWRVRRTLYSVRGGTGVHYLWLPFYRYIQDTWLLSPFIQYMWWLNALNVCTKKRDRRNNTYTLRAPSIPFLCGIVLLTSCIDNTQSMCSISVTRRQCVYSSFKLFSKLILFVQNNSLIFQRLINRLLVTINRLNITFV